MKNFYTESDINFILENYSKMGINYCAEILKRPKNSLKTKAYFLGLKLDKKVDYNQFINITTKEVAYILGLLWADGHVTFANNKAKTPIVKHSSNPVDNETFLKIFKITGDWNTFTTKNVGSFSKTPCDISINYISSRKIGEFLIENDYRNKLKSPYKILSKIPDNLKCYWYRGYFDGDGSVSIKSNDYHSIAFISNENQDWTFIIDLLEFLNINKYRIRTVSGERGKSSQIGFTRKDDIKTFENYIYEINDNLGLQRKRDKFKLL